MAEDAATEVAVAQQRSPAFPYIPLNLAIDRVKIIHSKIKDFPQNRDQVAKAYGKPAKSSATLQTLATLQQYGLMENITIGPERRLRVTDLAKVLVHPHAPRDQYQAAVKKAALLPKIFQELWDRYQDLDGLSDDVPMYYLTHDRKVEYGTTYTDQAAKDVLRVYRASLAFAGVAASDNISASQEAVDEWDEAAPSQPQGPPVQEAAMIEPHREVAPSGSQASPHLPAGSRSDTCNIPEGMVVLSFPEEFSQESLEDIEAWLDFQKNRLKRWVRPN